MRIRLLKAVGIAGERGEVGEIFDLSPSEAHYLVGGGRAEYVKEEDVPPVGLTMAAAGLEADDADERPEPAAAKKRPRRRREAAKEEDR